MDTNAFLGHKSSIQDAFYLTFSTGHIFFYCDLLDINIEGWEDLSANWSRWYNPLQRQLKERIKTLSKGKRARRRVSFWGATMWPPTPVIYDFHSPEGLKICIGEWVSANFKPRARKVETVVDLASWKMSYEQTVEIRTSSSLFYLAGFRNLALLVRMA